jgi:uncharacterized protein YutE (UPF0331/DUF86 family)
MVFKTPAFARLSPKILKANSELNEATKYYARNKKKVEKGDWGSVSAISLGVHNVYNGIEDILLSIAKDVDRSTPTGEFFHQDLLDQMASGIAGKRPPIFDRELYDLLSELKAFRHLVRHKYGVELKPEGVVANLQRVQTAFPLLVKSIQALESYMLGEAASDEKKANSDENDPDPDAPSGNMRR